MECSIQDPFLHLPDFMSWGRNSLIVVEVYTTLEVYDTGGRKGLLRPAAIVPGSVQVPPKGTDVSKKK